MTHSHDYVLSVSSCVFTVDKLTMTSALFACKPYTNYLVPISAISLTLSATGWADANKKEPIEQLLVSGESIVIHAQTTHRFGIAKNQGVDFFSAGGISSLPVIRGLNDDRIKLMIDGAETTSACANHMNPALSYIDASRINSVDVIAGITPVSMGGDSIAGTIVIESDRPRYADNNETLLTTGTASYLHRSNNHTHSVSFNTTLADDQFSLTYSGSHEQAESYHDGNGDKVLDTLYRSDNHSLTLGFRDDKQSMTVKVSHQEVPYQGFPNQYMDMVGNISDSLNLQFVREFQWGELDTRLFWQKVDHEMGFFSKEKPGTMPMLTEGKDIGYKIKAELPLANDGSFRIGQELHQFNLNDWWPAVEGSTMMGPNDFININEGERNRYAFYIETDNHWDERWQSLFGLRYEKVTMDTGNVQPYNTMPGMGGMNRDPAAATAFNAQNHRRTDDNIDLTALGRLQISPHQLFEFGYARKTRSPNLYERYSWGRNTMSMTMLGWFGDGNGYLGDIDLAPEIAHTLSVTWSWQSEDKAIELAITPYYSYIDDYIDAEVIGSFHPRNVTSVTRQLLEFSNSDAEIYGIDIKGEYELSNSDKGRVLLNGDLRYTKSERKSDGSALYQIMPLNLNASLQHQLKAWRSSIELEWVDHKHLTDPRRLEADTGSYMLINLKTEYQWQQITLTAGIRNALNRDYEQPLGGVYLSGWLASDRTGQYESLPGEGRSIDLGINYQF